MRTLAEYFYSIIKHEYEDWFEINHGKSIPGRFALKEFDPELLSEILEKLKENNEFPFAQVGSDSGFIIATENHEKYKSLTIDKNIFADLAHERNRDGNFFCLFIIAEVKPTFDQVRSIDQSTIFEANEIVKWIEIAKIQQKNHHHFLDEHVAQLAKFISELTNTTWNNRPFIEVNKINSFIDEVIAETIRSGLFFVALGKSCVKLGGINRLDEFDLLQKSGSSYRRAFRSTVTKTLFKDIDFWRAYNKDKEVELNDIKHNLELIKESGGDFDEFCSIVQSYFEAHYIEKTTVVEMHRTHLQLNFDSSYPYGSVLQAKKTKTKFLLGLETINYFNDSDIELIGDEIELLEATDRTNEKPDINELRKFYFQYSQIISENTKLDKAWVKEVTDSKVTECSNLIIGILEILSKSLLLNNIGDDIVYLELAKERGRRSLERKNWYALEYFNNEYKDLEEFWSKFGANFKLDFGTSFNSGFADTVKKKKSSDSKSANELSFRVVRKALDKENNVETPISSWELKWIFNPHGFESSKYSDFSKVLSRKGFFYSHSLSLDPLFIKRAENTPSIKNIHMFLATSSNMKKGSVVKKGNQESKDFFNLLEQLHDHNHLKDSELDFINAVYHKFESTWRESLELIKEKPLCGNIDSLLKHFEQLINAIYSLPINREWSNTLVYEILSAHSLSVKENSDYCTYLPWSPYSLLLQSNRNKMLLNLATQYREDRLGIANKSEGVLAKLFRELLDNHGKTLFLKKLKDNEFVDLISTKSHSGYFEFGKLNTSKNSITEAEIRSVINATSTKFLETYPNERHHLQILCLGLSSYEQILAVYDELQKLAENHEEQLSVSLAFSCDSRISLDSIYQSICESFESSKVDSNINIRIISNIRDVEDGEIDLIYNFDPLFAHNQIASVSPNFVEREFESVNWEYTSSRKVPSDPIARKTQFAMNNHIHDKVGRVFHSTFMKVNNLPEKSSFCREVSQHGLKDEIKNGLSKCNWLVIYDFLLSKETLVACSENEVNYNKRVLRYIQGEGSKRSLAIITDKETHYITKNLTSDIRSWHLIHTDKAHNLVEEIFTRSNSFSSDTLLRSVGNGNFSHDLVGTAGAASLLENLFKNENKVSPIFWVHLDDYLSWFKSSVEDDTFKSMGKTVNYISDLLGIYISKGDKNEVSLNLIVSESKLTNGSKDQLTKSCKQVKSTVDLISSMLNSYRDLDFEYWLNKFYEFIVGHFKFSPGEFDFENLISLDKKLVDIKICGLSVVFHYNNEQAQTNVNSVYDCDYLYQLQLSSNDTCKVFQSLLAPEEDLNLFKEHDFGYKKLNQSHGDESIHRNYTNNTLRQSKIEFSEEESSLSTESNVGTSKKYDGTISEHLNTNEIFVDNKPISDDLNESNLKLDTSVKSAMNVIRTGINFLQMNSVNHDSLPIDISIVEANIRKIFGHANLPSNFSDSLLTPNSIVIKLHGDVNLNPAKILKLKANFLSVVGLKLRQVYPDPGVMVLVFDRDKRETVYFGELLNRTLEIRSDTILNNFNNKILLGQNEFGDDSVFFKLDGASPHALIGGQTKSGKSILMNNMIIDLLMTNSPENLNLRLFDPKQVEFSAYIRAPHLAHPVVLDKAEAVVRLQELENLMNERYRHLMKMGIKDFETHNKKFPNDKMSREVVFFDELADWILDNDFKAEAKDIIVRLSSKGRAAGIHLVLATQRPSADVVFPLLRANLDTKIALKVDREQNSEIILGESGAENLLGYGHGIVKSEGVTHSIQVGFTEPNIFDELVNMVIEYWINKQSNS